MDPLGNAVMLFDLAQRVVGFINDLRHAQDDLVGLRSEAECLRICINALNSDETKVTLTHVSTAQKHDLSTIIKSCKQNMEDLNRFIASVEVIITGPNNRRSGSMNLGKYLRQKLARGFAKFKFTMKDKQPFRDKLMLPTASINIFLTSLTHFRLTKMLGSMPLPASIPIAVSTMHAQGTVLKGWDAIGHRIAFTGVAIASSDLKIPGLEDDIIDFAIELIKKRSGSGRNGRDRIPSISNSGRRASRSRNRGGIRKKNGQLYVRRQKSVSRMPDGIERVERTTYDSDSDSGPEVLLIEPPPDSSSFYRTGHPELIDSDDDSSIIMSSKTKTSDPEERTAERLRRAEEELRRERIFEDNFEDERRQTSQSRTRTRLPRKEEDDLRRSIKQDIEREKQQYIRQISRTESEPERTHMRMSKKSREDQAYVSAHPEVDEFDKALSFLEEEYGVIVEDIGDARPPIDNGYIGDIDEIPSDPEDKEPIVPPQVYSDRLRAETSRYRSDFDPGFRDGSYKMKYSGTYDTTPEGYGRSYRPDKSSGVPPMYMSSEKSPLRPRYPYWESSEAESYSDSRKAENRNRNWAERSRHNSGNAESIRIIGLSNEDKYQDDLGKKSTGKGRERHRSGRSASGINIVDPEHDEAEIIDLSHDTYIDTPIHGPPYPRLNVDRRTSHTERPRDRHGSLHINPAPGSGQPPRGILRRRKTQGSQQDDDSDDPTAPVVVYRR